MDGLLQILQFCFQMLTTQYTFFTDASGHEYTFSFFNVFMTLFLFKLFLNVVFEFLGGETTHDDK